MPTIRNPSTPPQASPPVAESTIVYSPPPPSQAELIQAGYQPGETVTQTTSQTDAGGTITTYSRPSRGGSSGIAPQENLPGTIQTVQGDVSKPTTPIPIPTASTGYQIAQPSLGAGVKTTYTVEQAQANVPYVPTKYYTSGYIDPRQETIQNIRDKAPGYEEYEIRGGRIFGAEGKPVVVGAAGEITAPEKPKETLVESPGIQAYKEQVQKNLAAQEVPVYNEKGELIGIESKILGKTVTLAEYQRIAELMPREAQVNILSGELATGTISPLLTKTGYVTPQGELLKNAGEITAYLEANKIYLAQQEQDKVLQLSEYVNPQSFYSYKQLQAVPASATYQTPVQEIFNKTLSGASTFFSEFGIVTGRAEKPAFTSQYLFGIGFGFEKDLEKGQKFYTTEDLKNYLFPLEKEYTVSLPYQTRGTAFFQYPEQFVKIISSPESKVFYNLPGEFYAPTTTSTVKIQPTFGSRLGRGLIDLIPTSEAELFATLVGAKLFGGITRKVGNQFITKGGLQPLTKYLGGITLSTGGVVVYNLAETEPMKEKAAVAILGGAALIYSGARGIPAEYKEYSLIRDVTGSRLIAAKSILTKELSMGAAQIGQLTPLKQPKITFRETAESSITSARNLNYPGQVKITDSVKDFAGTARASYDIGYYDKLGRYKVETVSIALPAKQRITILNNIFEQTGSLTKIRTTGEVIRKIDIEAYDFRVGGKGGITVIKKQIPQLQELTLTGLSKSEKASQEALSNLLKGDLQKIVGAKAGRIDINTFEGTLAKGKIIKLTSPTGEVSIMVKASEPIDISTGDTGVAFKGIEKITKRLIPIKEKTIKFVDYTNKNEVKIVKTTSLQDTKIQLLVPGKEPQAYGKSFSFVTDVEARTAKVLKKDKLEQVIRIVMEGKAVGKTQMVSGKPEILTFKTRDVFSQELPTTGGGKGLPAPSGDDFGGGGGGLKLEFDTGGGMFKQYSLKELNYYRQLSEAYNPVAIQAFVPVGVSPLMQTSTAVNKIGLAGLMSGALLGSMVQSQIMSQIQTPIMTQIPVQTSIMTQVPIINQIMVQTPIQTQIQTPIQTQIQTPIQTQIQIPIQTQISTPSGVPRPPFIEKPIIPPPIIEEFEFEEKKKRKQLLKKVATYRVLLKKRGQFQQVGTGLTKQEAYLFGAGLAKRDIARTFKLQKVGEKEIFGTEETAFKPLPTEFREYKVRRGERIPTPGEFTQLNIANLQSFEEKKSIQASRRASQNLKRIMNMKF